MTGGTGHVHIGYGSVFNNQAGATFDIQNNVPILYAGGTPAMFNNAGTFVKSAGAGISLIGGVTQFINTGTVEVQSGALRFNDGSFTQTDGTAILNGGELGSSTMLDFQGGSLTGSGTVAADVDSAGEVSPGLSAGTINITGS